MTTNSFANLKSMNGDTKALWMSPFSQHLVIREANAEQRRLVDEELRGKTTGWTGVSDEQAIRRRRFLREDLAPLRTNAKILVMAPRSRPDTLDEIYCTVSVRQLTCLLAGGPHAQPVKNIGYHCSGVVVPGALRLHGFATAMVQRIIRPQTQLQSDQDTFDSADLKDWLQVGKGGVMFNGGYEIGTPAATMWNKYGQGNAVYSLHYRFPEVKVDTPMEISEVTFSSAEDICYAIEHHNQLVEADWMVKHQEIKHGDAIRVAALAPINEYMCRVELRKWDARENHLQLPQVWGVEINKRGSAEWAYMAFIHCIEESAIQVFSYHAPSDVSMEALLQAIENAEAIWKVWTPGELFIKPVSEIQVNELPGRRLFFQEILAYHRVTHVTGQTAGQEILELGQRQFYPAPSFL